MNHGVLKQSLFILFHLSSSQFQSTSSFIHTSLTFRHSATTSNSNRYSNKAMANKMSSSNNNSNSNSSESNTWSNQNNNDIQTVKSQLNIWPLDEYNIQLLNEVHPKSYNNNNNNNNNNNDDNPNNNNNIQTYDFIAIGAGAGGLVSSRQVARRGGKSAMISSNLAGGDCLNVGCVPSKALIRSARLIREVQKVSTSTTSTTSTANEEDFGVRLNGKVDIDFGQIMKRMRKLRAEIAPIDGHERGESIGVNVYQGFGRFVSEDTIEVLPVDNNNDDNEQKEDQKKDTTTTTPIQLKFKKLAICTGGRATIPSNIPGLNKAPYTTNETLFNLTKLPKRMIILGSGVVALEMAQTFATFGSDVTVLVRSNGLFPRSDPDAGPLIMESLKKSSGVKFLTRAKITNVETIKDVVFDTKDEEGGVEEADLPLMKVSIQTKDEQNDDDDAIKNIELECECLLVATGRTPNVENLNLDAANVAYDLKKGIIVDDNARSMTNPNVYSVGDCTADVPRLTHMSGEMAKVVVQNAMFDDDWKLSSLVVPSCMYTEPEFATAGYVSASVDGDENVDVYMTSLEHNDRSILDGDREGYAKVYCKKGTGTIVGCSIIGSRAGELINEATLAMKYGIPLEGIGRNIHCYPTTGESLMGCGLQLINSKWTRLD